MLPAVKVAEYFLSLSDPDIGDGISNLKIQKLLYYAQGFHLALKNEPLFEEDIYAWEYGPVVKEVYNRYKFYGNRIISKPNDFDNAIFTDDQKELLNEIYDVYGQFSALKLMRMTHNEEPWKETERDEIITHEKMKKFFPTLLNE